ncbi:hypothetical protein [Leisingera caerulea]|uniref:hypothetical protein n=1 Tax=Leisingera caerulea TaxID=506591 RepID=UPI0012B54C08|nr:hypothetical protein [Leisingera caerulea]
MNKNEIQLLNSLANTLLGMTTDPRIPSDAKRILKEQAVRVYQITENQLKE